MNASFVSRSCVLLIHPMGCVIGLCDGLMMITGICLLFLFSTM